MGEGHDAGAVFEHFLKRCARVLPEDEVEVVGGFEHAVEADDALVVEVLEQVGWLRKGVPSLRRHLYSA